MIKITGLNCINCGGSLNQEEDSNFLRCDYCGSFMVLNSQDAALEVQDPVLLTNRLAHQVFNGSKKESIRAMYEIRKIKHAKALPVFVENYIKAYEERQDFYSQKDARQLESQIETFSYGIENCDDPAAEDQVLDLLSHEKKIIIRQALANLEKFPRGKARPEILELLQHDDQFIRIGAMYALLAFRNPEDLNHIISKLHDKSSFVVEMAIEILAQNNVTRCVPELARLAEITYEYSDNDSDDKLKVRSAAIYALGLLGNEDVVDLLIRLYDSNNSEIEEEVIGALTKLMTRVSESGKNKIQDFLNKVS